MRSAGNFHPEWGYLAPAPGFMRLVRIGLVATAIGAVAGAAVVVSLVERPGSKDDTAIAAHALLTRAPVIGSSAATVASSTPHSAQPQPQLSAPPTTATPARAATPTPSVNAGAVKPDKADTISSPLPLPAPTDATVTANAPVADVAHVPAEADMAIAGDTAAEPRTPAKRSAAKRHRSYRRQETVRNRWRENGGYQPWFHLFSFRAGSPYSSN